MITLITNLLQGVKRMKASQAFVLLGLGLAAVVGGGVAFATVEHVAFTTALYWAVTTATTVGYGDVIPHNGAGRAIAVVEMVTAIPLFGGVFASATALAASTRLRRALRLDEHHPPEEAFVALYGDDPVLVTVAQGLAAAGAPVLLVGRPAGEGGSAPADGVRTMPEDPTIEQVVVRSEPERARQALVACVEEASTLVTAVHLRHIAPDLAVTALVRSRPIAQALRDLGTATVISLEHLVGSLLAKSLEAPHAGELLVSLVSSEQYRLSEVELPPEHVGERLSAMRAVHGAVVLAAIHAGALTYGVADDPTLDAGDHLLVLDEGGGRPQARRPEGGRRSRREGTDT
jgi:voltage-gated potassium channel